MSISGRNGGGGRITQRCALRPTGRCLRQRSLAGLESNLGRSFSSFPAWAEYLIADSFENSGAFESDGGGGRIRTFEVDDGRFTVCSLWPLGNPTRGNSYCRGNALRWWWGKDYSSLRSSPFGPLPLATFSRFRSSRTLIEGSHPSPTSANFCIAHRDNYIAVVKNGGGGRIRTFEVDDGRFTVCSLWPLGNPTTG